jgi:MYXO-CTERM domain-containing protein
MPPWHVAAAELWWRTVRRAPFAPAILVGLVLALCAAPAGASPQVWPFQFNPSLDPNPATIEADLDAGAASLPPLPVSELSTLMTDNGTMTLWFWPENATLLQSVGTAGPGQMPWPTTAVMCAQHAAFTMPTLTAADAGTTCANAAAQITQAIVPNLPACIATEQPEVYVYGYSPSDVAQDVDNVEDMIGLAGEALTHAGLPLSGLLPSNFVPTLRSVLDKIRQPALASGLQAAAAGYTQAQALLSANASCFDPTVAASLTTSLTALSGEVAAVSSYLQNLESMGEATAQQEMTCLAAKSQTRATLPYPGLTDADRTFVAFWLGGVYWRMRGGGLIPLGSTQEARLYYVEDGFGQIAAFLGGADGQNNVALPFFLELVVDGWSQWQSMGTNGANDDKYVDLIDMTERGQRQAQSAINGLGPLGYDTSELLTAGLQMGPGYYYGYYPLAAFRYAPTIPSPYSGFIDATTAIGEFNIGAALGLGLAKTLLPGKPTGQAPTATLCANRECGDDGCGGSCGTCEGGAVCNASGQCGDDAGADASPNDDAMAVSLPDGSADAAGPSPEAGPGSPDASSAPPVDAAVTDGATPGATGDGSSQGAPSAKAGAAGCGCAMAGAPAPVAPVLAFLAAAGIVVARRKRRRGRRG